MRRQADPLIEVSVAIISDDGRAFRNEGAYPTQMIEVVVVLTSTVAGCSPWIGIPPPPRRGLFPEHGSLHEFDGNGPPSRTAKKIE